MQALVKENQLLKGYVVSLQKENQARNIERNTLFHQIQRLTAEIQRLNAIQSQSNSRVVTNTVKIAPSISERQVQTLKDEILSLKRQIDALKGTNNQQSTNLRSKDNQILVLKQQQQRLISQIKMLKDAQSKWSSSNNKVVLLEKQISQYKIKFTQVATLEQNIKLYSSKIQELQNLNRRIENDYKRAQGDLKKQQGEIRRLESENRQLKLNSKSSLEMSNLLSSKLTLQANIRQLNSKIERLQSNNKNVQMQKSSFERRIKDLEKELLESKGKLTQLRYNQQSLKSVESNLLIKDKEMEALQQMIESLKQNKKYLQKALREKQQIIASLQTSNIRSRSDKSQKQALQRQIKADQQGFQKQITQLIEVKTHLQKQLSIFIKNSQDREVQLGNFYHKEQNYISQINMLQTERQRMLQDLNMLTQQLQQTRIQLRKMKNTGYKGYQSQAYFKVLPQRDIIKPQDQDLRMIVQGLKSEILELKASQMKPSKIIEANHNHNDFHTHMNLKSHLTRMNKSPVKGTHSKIPVQNQRDKSPFQKQKWDKLQKKIMALRSQNETLKKSLFD